MEFLKTTAPVALCKRREEDRSTHSLGWGWGQGQVKPRVISVGQCSAEPQYRVFKKTGKKEYRDVQKCNKQSDSPKKREVRWQ